MTKFMVQNLGWVYFIVVIGWYTKKIVGFNLSLSCRSKEWKKALEMAVNTACPDGSRKYKINLMSDNGSQPTSIAFMNECSTLRIKQAFTAYDNPKGNADTERVIRSLKEECIWLNEWETFKEVIAGTRKGVKDYNMDHIHSALDYLSPDEFEKKLKKENTLKNAA